MPLTPELVDRCRRQFPALSRNQDGRPVVYLDGPAGTQVPQRVIDAVSDYLAHHNANQCGRFAAGRETDAMMTAAHEAVADLFGADDPDTVAFGPNMTTLTFAFSRALGRTWHAGDEVLVTRLDHDANITPWVRAAADAGATVRLVEIHREDCTLDLDDLRSKLSERTRLVAVGCASNSVGSINPVGDICRWAHQAGAEVFLDAVHFAPHDLVDVKEFGCDYLACSAYKFFGPHVGILWGRRERLEELPAYKVRPASDSLPSKWMTGTQNHEGIAGVLATVEYLAEIGRAVSRDDSLSRREALREGYAAIREYEGGLLQRLLAGLAKIEGVRVYGITDEGRLHERLPTVSLTHARHTPAELAEQLGRRGIFTWHGNYYALCLTEALGLEPHGMLRLGLVHYNTADEVDRVLAALREIGES
ncbi:MAG: cysteine desulfurase-like protein [Planctomycetes bacterium]|nr:cysteine desulfurase-like protein [Planctomycetota bacterium]